MEATIHQPLRTVITTQRASSRPRQWIHWGVPQSRLLSVLTVNGAVFLVSLAGVWTLGKWLPNWLMVAVATAAMLGLNLVSSALTQRLTTFFWRTRRWSRLLDSEFLAFHASAARNHQASGMAYCHLFRFAFFILVAQLAFVFGFLVSQVCYWMPTGFHAAAGLVSLVILLAVTPSRWNARLWRLIRRHQRKRREQLNAKIAKIEIELTEKRVAAEREATASKKSVAVAPPVQTTQSEPITWKWAAKRFVLHYVAILGIGLLVVTILFAVVLTWFLGPIGLPIAIVLMVAFVCSAFSAKWAFSDWLTWVILPGAAAGLATAHDAMERMEENPNDDSEGDNPPSGGSDLPPPLPPFIPTNAPSVEPTRVRLPRQRIGRHHAGTKSVDLNQIQAAVKRVEYLRAKVAQEAVFKPKPVDYVPKNPRGPDELHQAMMKLTAEKDRLIKRVKEIDAQAGTLAKQVRGERYNASQMATGLMLMTEWAKTVERLLEMREEMQELAFEADWWESMAREAGFLADLSKSRMDTLMEPPTKIQAWNVKAGSQEFLVKIKAKSD